MIGRKTIVLLAILAAFTGGLPPFLYWLRLGRVPSIDPIMASNLLWDEPGQTLLIDVRIPSEFAAGHLEGSLNWPYAQILALRSVDEIPPIFTGKRVLLICGSGISSADAARRLREIGISRAYSLHGGIQAWIAAAEDPPYPAVAQMRLATGQLSPLPYESIPAVEQWAAVLAGFVVKPLYMLLAAVLIVALRRQRSSDLSLLRWGLAFFLAGEAFCSVNYIFFNEMSDAAEYLHSIGMILGLSLMLLAALEGMDARLIHYTDPSERCSALALCRRCAKGQDVPCALRRLFKFVMPALIVCAAIPLAATPVPVSYNTSILGTPYNYTHAVLQQLFEVRYSPLAAVALLSVAWVVLLLREARGVAAAKALFCLGSGYLIFAMLRLFLLHPFAADMTWFVFWEEVTELLLMLAVAAVLFAFRPILATGTPRARPFAQPTDPQRA